MDYFAIISGNGRIKTWDTFKGQIQTELQTLSQVRQQTYMLRQKQGIFQLITNNTRSRGLAIPSLLQLSGRLQLARAQAGRNKSQLSTNDHQMDESEDEDYENVDDVLYGEEDESQISSDDDDD